MKKEEIMRLMNVAEKNKDKYLVVLVCNVKGITKTFNNFLHSDVESEFYSSKQLIDVKESVEQIGYECIYYYDEATFINEFENNKIENVKKKELLVINTAQKGNTIGRKSLIPAYCDMNNIIYTNSNAYVSSNIRNKFQNYLTLKDHLPICKSWLYKKGIGWFFNQKPPINQKVIMKLNYEASSIGLTNENIFLYNENSDDFIREFALEYEQDIIVQEFISGYEVEIPTIRFKDDVMCVLGCGIKVNNEENLDEVILDNDIRNNSKYEYYNYKYDNLLKMYEVAEQVIKHLDIESFGRVDFRIDNNNNFYITDISTNPHLTKSLSFYYGFKENGYTYDDVFRVLIGVCINEN